MTIFNPFSSNYHAWSDLKFHFNFVTKVNADNSGFEHSARSRSSKALVVAQAALIVFASLALLPFGAGVFRSLINRLTLLKVENFQGYEDGTFSGLVSCSSNGPKRYDGKFVTNEFTAEGKWGFGKTLKGKITYNNGNKRIGTFDDKWRLQGKGEEISEVKGVKTVFKCDYVDGKPHGFGTLKENGKVLHKGEWKNGLFNRLTISKVENFQLNQGKKFTGLVSNSSNGPKPYDGTLVTNEFTAEGKWGFDKTFEGKITYNNGNILIGTFDDKWRLQGKGEEISEVKGVKTVFKCYYVDGKRHGFGILMEDGKVSHRSKWNNGKSVL